MFARQEHAGQIHIETSLPGLKIELRGDGVSIKEQNAGVGHNSIQAAKATLYLQDRLFHLLLVYDIDSQRQGYPAGIADLTDRLFGRCEIDVQHTNARAFFAEPEGRRAADSCSPARDDRSFAS